MAAALTGSYATEAPQTQSREKKESHLPRATGILLPAVSAVANQASSFSITFP